MGYQGAIIFIGAIVALAVVLWGAFRSRGSLAIVAVAVFVAVLAAGCGWYALAESKSIPWTIGYGVVVVLSISVGMKHVIGNRDKSEG